MYVDVNSIMAVGAAVTVGSTLAALLGKLLRWYGRQNEQDKELCTLRQHHEEDMSATKEELTLITYGLLACLKGLKEQGCNGPVTEAIHKIEKHLNIEAHK